MTKHDIYAAIGNVGDDLIENSAPSDTDKSKKKKRRAMKLALRISVVAACFCIMLCGIYSLIKLGYFTANCGSSSGILVDGVYYYHEKHKGICAYTPGEGTKFLISDLFRDDVDFEVNSYGVYYTWGRTLYVRVHESGNTVTLYKADPENWTHIRCGILNENSIVLRLYNKNERVTEALLLDCKTGEIIQTLSELSTYANYTKIVDYTVGQRVITCTYHSGAYVFTENGTPLFDDDISVSLGSPTGLATYAGDNLIIDCYKTVDNETVHYSTLIRPDGSNKEIYDIETLMGGTNDYLLDVRHTTIQGTSIHNAELCVYDIETGASTVLIGSYTDYEAITDGTYLYTCAPWSHETKCYRLIYDENGIPSDVEPISENIGQRVRYDKVPG